MRTVIKPKCPFCQEVIQEVDRVDFGDSWLINSLAISLSKTRSGVS